MANKEGDGKGYYARQKEKTKAKESVQTRSRVGLFAGKTIVQAVSLSYCSDSSLFYYRFCCATLSLSACVCVYVRARVWLKRATKTATAKQNKGQEREKALPPNRLATTQVHKPIRRAVL